MSKPEISVVLATRDRPRRLAAQLAALQAQTLAADRYEIVVVDDRSGQETVELLWGEAARSGGPSLRVIRRERPSGVVAAHNAGWRAARSPLIAFTDETCKATPEWLAALLQCSRAHPGAIVQGETEPDPEERQQAGPFCDTLISRRAGPWFDTANILYPRELLERLDGFDEQSFPCRGGADTELSWRTPAADTDLAWRALAAGTEAVRAPRAVVFQAVEEIGRRRLLRRAWKSDQRRILCCKRHPGLRHELAAGVFLRDSHLYLALALLASWRRLPGSLRLALALPYARRLYAGPQTPTLAPFRLALDLTEAAACARGSMRHRVIVI
jgi:GT2 family glycosyltransferase